MLCMLYLLYYIVIFKVVACVCNPDVLCIHFCIIYVCMFVYMPACVGWCISMYIYIYIVNVLYIYSKGFISSFLYYILVLLFNMCISVH